MRSDEAQPTQRPRRSCTYYGCLSVVVLVLAMTAWIASGFVFWQQITIPLPDGSGSVVYMARLNKILCAEWSRKVRIETKRFPSKTGWLPVDTCGAWPVNVYWYPEKNGTGPYVRFHDPLNEYLVDLRHGTSLLVWRPGDGSAYVGQMRSGWLSVDCSGDPLSGEWEVQIDGRPARKLEERVASRQGTYIGRIDHPRYGFVSAEESPEEELPEH